MVNKLLLVLIIIALALGGVYFITKGELIDKNESGILIAQLLLILR